MMMDDYKYSVGRAVVYRHPDPGRPHSEYGQHGPKRTVGEVRSVELGAGADEAWIYTIENLRTGETARVREADILHATYNKRRDKSRGAVPDAGRLAQFLAGALSERPLESYLRDVVRDTVRREDSEERARREGRDLPVEAGDYIRVRGELRTEIEPIHNHYAKVLEVAEPEIAGIEWSQGTHVVRHRYRILADDGSEYWIYDPEIHLYYTANGRTNVLNWRAATFLAESFHDDPPYRADYSYLQDHVFSRAELESLSYGDLVRVFARLLYVKGRIGLRDLEDEELWSVDVPVDHLIDDALAISRFDMRKNRSLTHEEIEQKRLQSLKLRDMLDGG